MAPALSRSAHGWLGRTAGSRDGLSQPWTGARLPLTASFPGLPAPPGAGAGGRGWGGAGLPLAPPPTLPRCALGLLRSARTGAFYQAPPAANLLWSRTAVAVLPSSFTLTLSRSTSAFSHFSLVPDSGLKGVCFLSLFPLRVLCVVTLLIEKRARLVVVMLICSHFFCTSF